MTLFPQYDTSFRFLYYSSIVWYIFIQCVPLRQRAMAIAFRLKKEKERGGTPPCQNPNTVK